MFQIDNFTILPKHHKTTLPSQSPKNATITQVFALIVQEYIGTLP